MIIHCIDLPGLLESFDSLDSDFFKAALEDRLKPFLIVSPIDLEEVDDTENLFVKSILGSISNWLFKFK